MTKQVNNISEVCTPEMTSIERIQAIMALEPTRGELLQEIVRLQIALQEMTVERNAERQKVKRLKAKA